MGLGNQQERLALVGYLAGIIDGEGCIMLSRQTGSQYASGFTLRPIIAVHMVGRDTIDHLRSISDSLGLETYSKHFSKSSRWATYGTRRTIALLDVVQPFLFVKAKQAGLLREFVSARQERPYRSSVSDRELEIRHAISSLNTKGKNPQRLYA